MDIIEFDNDSLTLYESKNGVPGYEKRDTKLITQNGYTVLFIGLRLPLVLFKEAEGRIIAVKYGEIPEKIELIEIN